MLASRMAKVQSPKNSAKRFTGMNNAAMALPVDWLEPMQMPAKAAAHQKTSLLLVKAATTQVMLQPTKVSDKANL